MRTMNDVDLSRKCLASPCIVYNTVDHFAPAHCHDAAGRMHQTVETLYTMMAQDFSYSFCDYLLNENSCSTEVPNETTAAVCHTKVTADDRTKIVDWCYSIIDMCQLDRETVAMAMSIVDRFMSNRHRMPGSGISSCFSHQEVLLNRSTYQLVAVSALYIAVKINERVNLSSDDLAALSRGIYSKESIEAMERTILDCLAWRVSAPTAFQVGHVIIELMIAKVQKANASVVDVRRWESIREELAYQTEIAIRDYQLALQRPSNVAYMAIVNAIQVGRKVNDCMDELLLKALVEILQHVNSSTFNV
jgi:hypothetical protein